MRGFEMMRVQTVPEHPVKADVAYPNEDNHSEICVRTEKNDSAKPYRQHIAVHHVEDHAGRSIRTAHKTARGLGPVPETGLQTSPSGGERTGERRCTMRRGWRMPRREGALRVEGMFQLS